MGCKKLLTSDKLFRPLSEIGIEEIAEEMQVDLHSKKLKLHEHVKLLVAYVLCPFESLNELCEDAKAYENLMPISSGQLSKVNTDRTYAAFALVFYALLCHRTNYRKYWKMRVLLGKKILGLDSTHISLKHLLRLPVGEAPLLDKEKRGMKIHLAALLGELVQPLSAIVTPGNVHDSSMFDELLSDVSQFEDIKDLILVMDKGYNNYERFKELKLHGVDFVVRLKKNADYTILEYTKYENYTDHLIRLEKNGLELRMVDYKDLSGEGWTFITTISPEELSGHEIRMIYMLRWMIEIFFRQLKQCAKIEHLISKSVNGLLIQIYCTLIAYTLVNMFRIECGFLCCSMEKMSRRIRHYFNTPIEHTDFG